jgi:hypothetical protein
MRPEQKTKSRQKLYARMEGTKEIAVAAGISAVGSVDFAAKATTGDTIVVNGTVFEFQAGASEAAGTSAGTVADPHLITLGADLAATCASFAVALLAEDGTGTFAGTTGVWGVIYPDDSVGVVDDTTSKTTITFWPGTWANSLTMFDVTGLTAAPTVVQPGTAALGVNSPSISKDVNVNVIDASNHTNNQEYYVLADGDYVGQEVKVIVSDATGGATPTILGHLGEAGVAMVECEFITAEPGQQVTFSWTGSVWEMVCWTDLLTVPDFTAA